MLRWMLALVIGANLLFLAWSRQWLAPFGWGPVSQNEPQRLQQQVRPEAIVLHPVQPEETRPKASTPQAYPDSATIDR